MNDTLHRMTAQNNNRQLRKRWRTKDDLTFM